MTIIERPHLTLVDKLVVGATWTATGALFFTVGWLAVAPDDPLGPVDLFARHGAAEMIVQVMGLAVVTAGLATVLAGRRLIDIGIVAVGLGIMVATLRANTAEPLILQAVESGGGLRALGLRFAAESLAWIVVMMLAIAVSTLMLRWFAGPDGLECTVRFDNTTIQCGIAAGADVPGVRKWLFPTPLASRTAPDLGLKHMALVGVLGALFVQVLSTGLHAREIRHGQVCFVVAAGIGLACYVAHKTLPVRSPLWSVLGACLTALLGYLFAAVWPGEADLPANIPPNHFLRILPVQFVSVGCVSAVAIFWSHYVPVRKPTAPAHDVQP